MMLVGPVLGMVAVTLWFLMVSDDVTTTLDLGRAKPGDLMGIFMDFIY